MVTVIELFYLLLVLLAAYFMFSMIMRSSRFHRMAAKPLAPEESEEAILRRFEESREDVAETILITESHARNDKNRARRLRKAATEVVVAQIPSEESEPNDVS